MTSRPGSWPSSGCRSGRDPAGRAGRCPWRRWSASCAGSASTRTPRRRCPRPGRRPAGPARRCDRRRRPAAGAGRPDPEHWWGLRPLELRRTAPVVPAGRSGPAVRAASWPASWPARGSGSCPGRRAAESARSTAASFGSVVHVLTDHGARTGCRPGRAHRPSGTGLAPARLRRQLAVRGRAGRGGVGAGTVRGLAAGPARSASCSAPRWRSPAGRPGRRSGSS